MGKVYSGNNIVIKIGNNIIGLLQDLTADEDYGPVEASGIGDISVVEWVPTINRITLSCSSMAIQKNFIPSMGDNLFTGDIFPSNIDAYLRKEPFNIAITDKLTGALIRQYDGCVFARGTLSVRKHAIVGSNCTFVATKAIGGSANGFTK